MHSCVKPIFEHSGTESEAINIGEIDPIPDNVSYIHSVAGDACEAMSLGSDGVVHVDKAMGMDVA